MTTVSNDALQPKTNIRTIAQIIHIKPDIPISLFHLLLITIMLLSSGCSPTPQKTANHDANNQPASTQSTSHVNDCTNNCTNNGANNGVNNATQTTSTTNPTTQTGTQAKTANTAVDLAEIDKLLGEKTPKVPTVNKKTGQLSVAPNVQQNVQQNSQQTDNQLANSDAMSQDNSYAKAISKGLAIGFNYELQNDDHWTDKQRNCFGTLDHNFLTQDIQQILVSRLTPAELNYLNDFQRSPVGRKINKWAENNVDAFIDGIDPDVDDLNLTTKETLLVISFAASPTERKLKQFINEDSLGLLMLSKTQYKMVNCGMI